MMVNNDVLTTIRLGPVAWDYNRDFIGCGEIPTMAITVVVYCELDRYIVAPVFIEYLQSVLEYVSPAVVCEDQSLQALHHNLIQGYVALHPVFEGLVWIVYVKLCIHRVVSVTGSE